MTVLIGNWWTFVVRGVLAILFGLLVFVMPGIGLLTLVFLWGFYALLDGALNITAAFRRNRGADPRPWWALLIQGILGIVAGLLAFFIPGLTALVLLFLIGGWAIATGVLEIIAAIRLRKQIRGEWLLALMGVLSIALGALLFLFPGAGALAVVLWIGAYAVVFGAMLIALGLRLRSWLRRAEHPGGHDFPSAVAPGH